MAPYQEALASHYTVSSGFLIGNLHPPTIVSSNDHGLTNDLKHGHQPTHANQNLDGSHLSLLPGVDGSSEATGESEATSESVIIICSILAPFVIGFIAIITVALLIRRMRRAKSMKEVSESEKVDIPLPVYTTPRSISRDSLTLSQILGLDLDPLDLDSITTDGHRISSCPTDPNDFRIQSLPPISGTPATPIKDKENNKKNLKRSMSMKNLSFKTFGSKIIFVLTFPKRMRQKKAEKKRFNFYNLSPEAREQLKHIYVY